MAYKQLQHVRSWTTGSEIQDDVVANQTSASIVIMYERQVNIGRDQLAIW